MIHQWQGQRVVFLCGRYIWRGKVESVEEPLVSLSEAYQVIDHGTGVGGPNEKIRQEIKVGKAILNMQSMESAFLEGDQLWIPSNER